jgi:predicted CoA-binding protein
MKVLPQSVSSFLQSDHIAVAGVSRMKGQPANLIFQRLRSGGSRVTPVNPHMQEFGGMACYPDLVSIPDRPDAVLIATHPLISTSIVEQAAALGIRKIWFHRSFGDGSLSEAAVAACKAHGLEPIQGGCPMMFVEPVDIGHRCMRWWLQKTGTVPR